MFSTTIWILRNHFLDRKTKFNDGLTSSKRDFDLLYKKITSEVTFGHKLRPIHLECKGFDRQNVRLACELISQTVASLLRHHYPRKESLANMIDLADTTFNLLTAQSAENSDFTRSALGGVHLQNQLDILIKFRTLVEETEFYGQTRFNKGIVMAINAEIELQNLLANEYNVPCLKTSRTTQECVLLFFYLIVLNSSDMCSFGLFCLLWSSGPTSWYVTDTHNIIHLPYSIYKYVGKLFSQPFLQHWQYNFWKKIYFNLKTRSLAFIWFPLRKKSID